LFLYRYEYILFSIIILLIKIKRIFNKAYQTSYTCKHIVALARTEKFKVKGFIPEETLVANNRTGRRKVQTLAGTEAKLTPNKTLKYTYKRK
jgi:hypothetical protein